ncbi:glycosyl hydrolase family 8 [Mucilaginibacter conchicola]|nr:glycosyl hydrolase family 8 [Mucilaginibacter conchicola]
MDAAVGKLYDQWKARYVKPAKPLGQSYVLADDKGVNKVISEGQGYGMVITVLMAGYDKNAQDVYNKLFRYYYAHRCNSRGTTLMKWVQYNNGKEDNSSAADGDLDIAYSLLLANKQWGSKGEINYLEKAHALLDDIKMYEVNKLSGAMLSSNAVEEDSKQAGYREYFSTRSSDFMPTHLRAFAAAKADDSWMRVITSTYNILNAMQAKNTKTGLIPDFMVDIDKGPKPAPKDFQGDEHLNCGAYDYNACRIPWRVGLDYVLHGDLRSQLIVKRMNNWIRRQTKDNPRTIADGYYLNGARLHTKPDALHLSFVAPFGVAAMAGKENQAWLNSIWAYLNLVTVKDYDIDKSFGYYDNSIKLICMIIMSGNYWSPEN